MSLPAIRVRPATDEDDAAIREISVAYDNLDSWPARPDFLDHEFATGRIYVAEGDGGVVGFGGSFDRDEVVYLADLFVRREALGGGVGAALLERIFDRGSVRMTSASGDPRALPLYARFGMWPLMPALYLRGSAAAAAEAAETMGATAGPDLGVADTPTIAAIDADVCGRSRPQEHAFLQSLPGAEGLVLIGEGGAVAYGWMRVVAVPTGDGVEIRAYLSPAGARTPEGMVRITAELVGRAADAVREQAASVGSAVADVSLLVLGTHPGLAALLSAGFRVVDRDTFMCSRVDLVDGRRYALSPELG